MDVDTCVQTSSVLSDSEIVEQVKEASTSTSQTQTNSEDYEHIDLPVTVNFEEAKQSGKIKETIS